MKTYRGTLTLLQAARIPLDAEIVIALFRLLAGSASMPFRVAREAVKTAQEAEDASAAAASAAGEPASASSGTGGKKAGKSTSSQLEAVLRSQGTAADPLLEEAFALADRLPDHEVVHGGKSGVLPHLMMAALRRGKRDRALQVVGAMQARGVPVPTYCFNALIESDAPLAAAPAAATGGAGSKAGASRAGTAAPVAPVDVHLRLMRDAGASPDAGTLTALIKAYLYRPGSDGTGVAAYAREMSAALGVPLSQAALGSAAFFAAKHGNGAEVAAVLQLLRDAPRRTDAPPPRWLRKIGSFVVDKVEVGPGAACTSGSEGVSAWWNKRRQ